METVPIIAILSIFIGAPAIVFGFILLARRGRNEVELAQYRLRTAELEVQKEQLRLEGMREENRKLDRIIEHRIEMP